MVEKYITPSHCLVDDDSRGRLAQDVNTFNAFFYYMTTSKRY